MTAAARTDRKALHLDGFRLEVRQVGPAPAAAPTLVLLHEALGCVGLWRDLPERLVAATGFGVHAYSRRGHGHSDPEILPRPLTYLVREAEEVLPRVLDRIGFRRGLLIGHSDGATIAALYAVRRNDPRVRGLVLIAPHVFVEERTLAGIGRAREAFFEGDLRRRLRRWHGANVDALFSAWADTWLAAEFRGFDMRAELSRIHVPVLAVQSEHDPYGTLAQIEAIRQAATGPVETLILSGASHAPHIDAADETVAAIAAFARRCLPPENDSGAAASCSRQPSNPRE